MLLKRLIIECCLIYCFLVVKVKWNRMHYSSINSILLNYGHMISLHVYNLAKYQILCKKVWHSDQMKGIDADIASEWFITAGLEGQVKRIAFWDAVFHLISCLFYQIYLYAYPGKKKKNTIGTAVHSKYSIRVRIYAMPNIVMEQAKNSTGFFFFQKW